MEDGGRGDERKRWRRKRQEVGRGRDRRGKGGKEERREGEMGGRWKRRREGRGRRIGGEREGVADVTHKSSCLS